MRPRAFAPIVVAALTCFVLLAPAVAREWSSQGGLKVQAELLAYDGTTARMVLKVGGVVDVPIARLSDADQAYLKSTYPQGKSPEMLKKKPRSPMPGGGGSASVQVQPVGLAITKSIPNLPPEVSPLPPGTHLLLLVSDASVPLVGIDTEKSKIVSFTDNKGTDLSEGEIEQPFEFLPLPDGKSGLVHLHQPQVPIAKAVRVTVKGQLHLQSGTGGETIQVPLNLDVMLGF